MPLDDKLLLASASTQTGTHNETGIAINGVPVGHCLYARIRYSAATNASGSNSVQFIVQHSDDNITYNDHVVDADQLITLSTTAQSGMIFLPIATQKKWVRLREVFVGAGSTPTITVSAEIVLAKV